MKKKERKIKEYLIKMQEGILDKTLERSSSRLRTKNKLRFNECECKLFVHWIQDYHSWQPYRLKIKFKGL